MPDQPKLKKSLTLAALIMTGSVFLSRVLGLARDLVLAHCAGTDSSMEAYVAAFLLPEVINHLLAGGFLSVTFIPLYQRHLINGEPQKAQRTYCNLLTLGTIALAAILAVCAVYAGRLLYAIEALQPHREALAQRPPEWIALTTRLTRIILPAQIFLYWGSFLMAVQYAHQKFLLPALMPLCYNLGIIVGGVCLWPVLGIEGFAWGVLAGSFAGGVAVQLPGVWRLGIRFRPIIDIHDPDLYKYIALSLPFVAGISMTFSNEFLFRFFGLFLPQGAIASLNYALRVMMLVVGIFGLAIGAASFPFLSRLAAEGKTKEMADLASRIINRTCALVLPVCAVMFATAPEIIAILFERGQFTSASTLATAPPLQMYLIGAFAFAASAIVVRCFYALQNTLLPMIVGTASVIATTPLYWLLGRRLGTEGIGLAATIGAICQFLALLIFWSARLGDVGVVKKTLWALARIALAAASGGVACAAIRQALIAAGWHLSSAFFATLLLVITAGGAGMLVAFVLLDLLRVQSMRETVRFLVRA